MTAKLFREEVLAARQAQWLGTIRIGRPLSWTLTTSVAGLLAAGLITFAILGQITRKARLPGLLMPELGTLQVAAPQAGVLAELNVKEGDTVVAGQALALVSTDRETQQGALATLVERSLAERRAALETEQALAQRQARERTEALSQRLRNVDAERRHGQDELDALQGRLRLAARSAERYQQLVKEGFASDLQGQQKHEEWLELRARERGVQRTLTALAGNALSLKAELAATATALQTQLAQIERARASLEQEASENAARGRVVLTAAQDAIVSAISSHAGQALQPGQALMTLVPRVGTHASALEAQLYAPSRTAGFVQQGQQVWLRLAAYPYQKFGMAEGRITAISRTPINPQDLPQGQAQALAQAAQSNEPLYRISVKLHSQHIAAYGQPHALKAGMALDADVIQDRRAVWEWVLEPALSATGTLGIPDASPAHKPAEQAPGTAS